MIASSFANANKIITGIPQQNQWQQPISIMGDTHNENHLADSNGQVISKSQSYPFVVSAALTAVTQQPPERMTQQLAPSFRGDSEEIAGENALSSINHQQVHSTPHQQSRQWCPQEATPVTEESETTFLQWCQLQCGITKRPKAIPFPSTSIDTFSAKRVRISSFAFAADSWVINNSIEFLEGVNCPDSILLKCRIFMTNMRINKFYNEITETRAL